MLKVREGKVHDMDLMFSGCRKRVGFRFPHPFVQQPARMIRGFKAGRYMAEVF